jgi:sortase system peptidoglycan-associated protein
MNIKQTLAASLLTIVAGSTLATDAFAADKFSIGKATAKEEHRGALGGAVIGAALGGPVGAGAGAILGGAVFGKLWGKERLEDEFHAQTLAENLALKEREDSLGKHIAELNQDIDTLLAKSSEWQSRQLPIQFKTASAEIEGHYEPQLREVAALLARNPDTSVVLSGFADRRGDSEYNQALSENRVAQVKAYLLSRGVKRNQVMTQAFGESQPVADEGSSENHFFDRRVVMAFEVDMRSPLATR